MTLSDAVALSILTLTNRRLVSTLFRLLSARATADDLEQFPAVAPGEPPLDWCARCLSEPAASSSTSARLRDQAARSLELATRHGIRPVHWTDPAYPLALLTIADPPPVLWTRGDPFAWTFPSVAVVGSRAATSQALTTTRALAAGLCDAGITVVSGLARGVDAAAHRASVQAGGRTVGVLGCGVDRVYPAENADLARQMCERGAMVSEFPPEVPPRKHHFPLRNRLISGLARAVIVVEAPEKSGALITASAAAEQGRDVMVVPSSVAGARNRGGHLLIRDGARLVQDVSDVLEDLGWSPNTGTSGLGQTPFPSWLPEETEFSLDDIIQQSNLSTSEALTRLLELELSGRIQRIGAGRFSRVLT